MNELKIKKHSYLLMEIARFGVFLFSLFVCFFVIFTLFINSSGNNILILMIQKSGVFRWLVSMSEFKRDLLGLGEVCALLGDF